MDKVLNNTVEVFSRNPDVCFSDEELEKVVFDDVPYFDLTTHVLNIGQVQGKITYTSRHKMVICGTEEVIRIFKMFGIKTTYFLPSGSIIEEGTLFLEGKGKAEDLHKVWKATQVFLEYGCAMATRTYNLVSRARSVNPDACIVTTRKNFPFAKKLSLKAVLTGGAYPHRLGLSETVLIFGEHVNFYGGYEELFKNIDSLKRMVPEKRITVEVKDMDTAFKAVEAGVDIIQLDKFSVDDVKRIVDAAHPKGLKVAAAGGINESNIKAYASTGANILVLSCAYFGKPADIGVKLFKEE